jgi:hypothetical protein
VLLLTAVMPVGAIEVHGQVTNVGMNQFTWDNLSFPTGFYYDLNKNLGAETLTFRLSDATPTGATLSDEIDVTGTRGIVYKTQAQLKKFNFKPWGQYHAIGFLGDLYFAAYDPTVNADIVNAGETVALLYDVSKNRNLMSNDQISKILIDNKNG